MTPERKAALLDLLARVEKAEGPDREIDQDVEDLVRLGIEPREVALPHCPRCTASLTEVTALAESVLPEWKWSLSQRDASEDRSDDFYTAWMMRRKGPVYVEANRPAPALALLAALLKGNYIHDSKRIDPQMECPLCGKTETHTHGCL